ncbi:MAG TPA: class I SAM-dependent methyltransferase [Fodinibius sp.]|nr:class I SAM-dependent methyltransferase [Fodinibius sp.]
MSPTPKPDYTKLAEIYDAVMAEVDYDLWADYLDALMLKHHPRPQSVMELACGTGSLALSLDELECYQISGTDQSSQMIARARQKNRDRMCSVDFSVMDFLDINTEKSFDAVLCVFDSINYLHSPQEILQFLEECQKLLVPQSLLIFDFTTPANSVEAISYLNNEEGTTENNFRFHRSSTYNTDQQIHTNEFLIQQLENDQSVAAEFIERHQQKIYTLSQMLDIIDQTEYQLIAKYDGFEFEEATDESLRITIILQCPTTQS